MGPDEDALSLPPAGSLALASLLPKRDGKSKHCLRGGAADVRAIRDFEIAGRKCLQQLSREALDAIVSLLPSDSGKNDAGPQFSDGERDQILTLLTRHDGDGDGFLNRNELRE
eukprot:5194253-Amphidinium_carterae.1